MTAESGNERPNKSARKRELAALRQLAERMLGLSDGELEHLGVDAALREALGLVRPMHVSGARNRQLKHCVKLMDPDELQAVETYLDDRHSGQLAVNRQFHQIEIWRDRLVHDGDKALSALLDEFPQIDRQRVRQLIRDARREHEKGQPEGAGRKLFRYLRDEVFDDNI